MAGSGAQRNDLAKSEEGLRNVYDPAKKAKPGSLVRGPIRRREAVLVGINSYIDASVASLSCCVNDIRTMQQRLEGLGYLVHALHDEADTPDRKPTRSNVAGLLDAVCDRLDPDDMLLVQMSCHGVLIDGQCVLVMQDTWLKRVAQDGLPVSQIREAMTKSKARQLVLLLDACHSGVERSKNLSPEAAAADAAFNRRVLEQTEGFALLSSSTAAQVSQEWREKKLGLFTYFITEGLTGKASRDQAVVTVDDLRQYVRREMLRWNDQNPNRPVQEPTALTVGSGDILLADLSIAPVRQPPQSAASPPGALPAPPPARPSFIEQPPPPAYASPFEIAVACGCARRKQWVQWEDLASSRASWLFLLRGPKGEAHDLFLRRLEEDRNRAFQGSPPSLVLHVSWPRRPSPPLLADYQAALRRTLNAPSEASDSEVVERLKKRRGKYRLVLLHPILSRAHCAPELLQYYNQWWPELIEKSKGSSEFGVRLVQPTEWTPTGWFLRLVARLVTAVWPHSPDVFLRALSIQKEEQLLAQLTRVWGKSVVPLETLAHISEPEIVSFLAGLDLSQAQKPILEEIAPLDRESGYVLYNLIKQLPSYKDPVELLQGRSQTNV